MTRFFNTTRVNKIEYEEYLKRGFLNNEFKTDRIIYCIICIVFNIFSIISLSLFYKLQNSYIIRQRNFYLTFIAGLFAFLSVNFEFIPQFMEVPCLFSIFFTNLFCTVVNLCFISRSLRVILFYHYNIFKVSLIKKRECQAKNFGTTEIEPNSFITKISQKINKIITLFIIIPTLIALISILIIYILNDMNRTDKCPIFETSDTILNFKNNKARELHIVFLSYDLVYIVLNTIAAILLFNIKDTSKYGIKFECLSVCIMVLIFSFIDIFLQKRASIKSYFDNFGKINKLPRRAYLDIFERTKGGKMFYTFVSIYMLFASITLPVLRYYNSRKIKNINIEDPVNSVQYFYTVLNTPSLVEELKDIAIKEFSVENVLFWENFQVLRKMVFRYKIEYRKAKDMGDETMVSQYDFESYYQQQLKKSNQNSTFQTFSYDEPSYDPNMPVPKEILPYYLSFYNLFIDLKGPAVVNLLGETVKNIEDEIHLHPTIGIFDTAKNEVVTMMYSSIYPILLEKNEKYLKENME